MITEQRVRQYHLPRQEKEEGAVYTLELISKSGKEGRTVGGTNSNVSKLGRGRGKHGKL